MNEVEKSGSGRSVWWYVVGALILSLGLILSPLGILMSAIIFVFREPLRKLTKPKFRKLIVPGVVSYGLGAFIIFIVMAAHDRDQDAARRFTPHKKNEPRAEDFLKETCVELAVALGQSSKYSTAQKELLWKAYVDRPFKWDLEVVDIERKSFSKDLVGTFRCVPATDKLTDVKIQFPAQVSRLVLPLEKFGKHSFEGYLTNYDKISGLVWAEAVVREAVADK